MANRKGAARVRRFALGVPFLAYHVWRELRRDYGTEVLEEMKREQQSKRRGSSNQWNRGQPVFIIRVHGIEYLKTVDNGKAIDNLDNLPEF